MSTTYEKAIAQHDDLTTLLKDNEVFHSTSLDDFVAPDDEFTEWITPIYIANFKTTVNKVLAENAIWKLSKLYSLKHVCNADGAQKCSEIILSILLHNNNQIATQKELMSKGNLSNANEVNPHFTLAWTKLYNQLPPEYGSLREQYAILAYELIHIFQNHQRYINKLAIVKGIKDIQCSQELKEKLAPHVSELKEIQDLSSQGDRGISPWTIVVIVLIVVRIAMRLLR